jgi:hypothetical protein
MGVRFPLRAPHTSFYGRPDHWPPIGAINLDQGYYDFHNATADTAIHVGKFIEVWKVSRYYGQTQKTIVQLSGPTTLRCLSLNGRFRTSGGMASARRLSPKASGRSN